VVEWGPISQGTGCSTLLPVTGGGRGCFPCQELSRVCNSVRWWKSDETTSPSHSSEQTIPDSVSRHYGVAIDHPMKQVCACFSRLSHQVANGLPYSRLNVLQNCRYPGASGCSLLCCARESFVRSRSQFVVSPRDGCCNLLGIRNLKTTAYHPQCNGMGIQKKNST